MSRHREYKITCDDEGCEAAPDGYADQVDMCETRREAERVARQQGWSIGKRDLCPTHRRSGDA